MKTMYDFLATTETRTWEVEIRKENYWTLV